MKIKIALIALLFLCMHGVVPAYAEIFTKPESYSIEATGWQRNSIPNGDVFTCSVCDDQIQVTISYGAHFSEDALYKTNEEFLATFNTKEKQELFAKEILKQDIPLKSGYTISVERVGLTEIGGLGALQYRAIVEIGSIVSWETSMIAVHKNRLVKISLNYFDGGMNEKAQTAINSLYGSLKFSKSE